MRADAFRPEARRALSRLAAVLAALLLAGCASLGMYPRELVFSQEEMQARLERGFPVSRSARPIFELEFRRPQLSVDAPRGRLALGIEVRLTALVAAQAVEGMVTLSGVPRLDAANQTLLLSDLRVDALQVDKLAPETAETLRLVTEALVRQVLQEHPLYRIEPERLRFGGLTLRPTGLSLEPGRVVVRVEPARR